MAKKTAETYNDGVVRVYKLQNTAADGDKPKNALVLKEILRYKERTVGFKRYYAAGQANAQIDLLLRCAHRRNVSPQDIAIPNDGAQYRINRIQSPEDAVPRVMDLELQKVVQNFDIYKGP